MSKQCLNIEQMQHLKELGVDTSRASMALVYINKHGEVVDWEIVDKDVHEEDIGQYNPYLRSLFGSFTLDDVLDLLPEKIDGCCVLDMWKRSGRWTIAYTDMDSAEIYEDFRCDTLIECAYKMLCWVIENGYLKLNNMNFGKLREKLKYDIEHPKCKRCGKELYIPQPPKELYEKWGIMSWTAFVKQYAKHHGWHELENLNRNIVCNECLQNDDTPNTIILKSYDSWIEKYEEWRKGNIKKTEEV